MRSNQIKPNNKVTLTLTKENKHKFSHLTTLKVTINTDFTPHHLKILSPSK